MLPPRFSFVGGQEPLADTDSPTYHRRDPGDRRRQAERQRRDEAGRLIPLEPAAASRTP
ncbi:MAG TPA: hypothetical protein VIL85_15035 [Thermomicrobiales bacterium]